MIVAGDEDHLTYQEKKGIFGSDEIVSIAIPFGDALSAKSLGLLSSASESLAALPGIVDVDSLATVDDVNGSGSMLNVAPLLPYGPARNHLTPDQIKRISHQVRSNPIWPGFLISRDFETAAIDVRFDDDLDQAAKENLLSEIDSHLVELLGNPTFFFAGHAFMKSEMARTIVADLSSLTPLTFAVMACLLFMATQSAALTFSALGCVVIAILMTLGAMGWLGLPLTAISNIAPCILLALGTAYLMHICAAAQSPAAQTAAEAPAIVALRHTRKATVLAAVTTAIGYGSLSFSDVPIIRTFGLALALGMASILLVGISALPALLTLAPPGPRSAAFGPNRLFDRAIGSITIASSKHPRSILAVSLAVGLACLYGASHLEVNSSGVEKFRMDSRYRQSSAFYRSEMSGDMVENVYLGGRADEFLDPTVLNAVNDVQTSLEKLAPIDKTISIVDHIKHLDAAINPSSDGEGSVPNTQDGVAQYLLLLSSSGDGSELDELVSPDYSQLRIVMKASVPSSAASAELRDRIENIVEETFQGTGVRHDVLSTEILLSRAADTISVEQIRSFGLALLFIVAVVAFGFRSVASGLELILPNALPIALYLGTLVVLGFALSDATSIIAATALGIAVDSSVHMMASRKNAEKLGWRRRESMVYALFSAGRPIVVSTMLIAIGFSCLLFSDFRSIAALGGFTALTMIFCLTADLLILPAQSFLGGQPDTERQAALVTIHDRVFPGCVLKGRGGERTLEIFPPGSDGPEEISINTADRVVALGTVSCARCP